jgi:hypothetical protein
MRSALSTPSAEARGTTAHRRVALLRGSIGAQLQQLRRRVNGRSSSALLTTSIAVNVLTRRCSHREGEALCHSPVVFTALCNTQPTTERVKWDQVTIALKPSIQLEPRLPCSVPCPHCRPHRRDSAHRLVPHGSAVRILVGRTPRSQPPRLSKTHRRCPRVLRSSVRSDVVGGAALP